MKVGVITIKENYWSLNEFSNSAAKALNKIYSISHLHLNDTAAHSEEVRKLYRTSDIVVNLASRSPAFDRGVLVPTIFFGHAWMDHGAGINLYVNRKYFQSNDVITFASPAALKKFKTIYKSKIKSCVLPYFSTISKGIDINEAALRLRYGIPEKKKIVLYFGRLSAEKNIDTLIKVFKRIKYKDCCLVCVGSFTGQSTFGFPAADPGDYELKIASIVSTAGKRNIFFIKNVDRNELIKLLLISYISVNLSVCYEEDFGVSAVESMMVGIPAVCSRWGGLKSIVKSGDTGYLIDTKLKSITRPEINLLQAKNHIELLLISDGLRDKFSKRAIKRAGEKFSEAAFLHNIGKLINGIYMCNDKKPSCGELLVPGRIYREAYDEALRSKSVGKIYQNNPDIFRRLYSCYV